MWANFGAEATKYDNVRCDGNFSKKGSGPFSEIGNPEHAVSNKTFSHSREELIFARSIFFAPKRKTLLIRAS